MSQKNNKFESTFNPRRYLEEYYKDVSEENDKLLAFFHRAYMDYEPDSLTILEIGGGPTIYQLISMAVSAKTIHFSDYLSGNVDEVKTWLRKSKNAFNWDEFIARTISYENSPLEPSQTEINNRAELVRSKLTSFSFCDIFSKEIVDTKTKYDLISMNFVVESMCNNIKDVSDVISRMKDLIIPGGYLVMTGLLGADYWSVNGRKFEATNITESSIRKILEDNGFSILMMNVATADHNLADSNYQGYKGIFMIKAQIPN